MLPPPFPRSLARCHANATSVRSLPWEIGESFDGRRAVRVWAIANSQTARGRNFTCGIMLPRGAREGTYPLFTLRRAPRGTHRKTRGQAVRYSLLVRILHSLLHAGLYRRTPVCP